MLIASFMKFSEYCSNVEPPFVTAPVRFSKYPPRYSTIFSESAVAGLEVLNFTAFLAALYLSAAEEMPPKKNLLPPNVGLEPVGDVDLLVRGFPEVPLAGGGGELVP